MDSQRAEYLEIPARDDVGEFADFTRPQRFLALLAEQGVEVGGQKVVDLGTGYGSLAIEAARAGGHVRAYDADPERLRIVEQRAHEAGVHVAVEQANLLASDWADGDADVAFLVGVVEYAGLWNGKAPVADAQTAVLRSARKSLREGGTLVFASKNRSWPRFVVSDSHTGMPLVNNLPRRIADRISTRLTGERYARHIHTPRGWAKLLRRAGFTTLTPLVPYFSYQMPVIITDRPRFSDISSLSRSQLSEREREAAMPRGWLPRAVLMALAGSMRLPLSHSVLFLAR